MENQEISRFLRQYYKAWRENKFLFEKSPTPNKLKVLQTEFWSKKVVLIRKKCMTYNLYNYRLASQVLCFIFKFYFTVHFYIITVKCTQIWSIKRLPSILGMCPQIFYFKRSLAILGTCPQIFYMKRSLAVLGTCPQIFHFTWSLAILGTCPQIFYCTRPLAILGTCPQSFYLKLPLAILGTVTSCPQSFYLKRPLAILGTSCPQNIPARILHAFNRRKNNGKSEVFLNFYTLIKKRKTRRKSLLVK